MHGTWKNQKMSGVSTWSVIMYYRRPCQQHSLLNCKNTDHIIKCISSSHIDFDKSNNFFHNFFPSFETNPGFNLIVLVKFFQMNGC